MWLNCVFVQDNNVIFRFDELISAQLVQMCLHPVWVEPKIIAGYDRDDISVRKTSDGGVILTRYVFSRPIVAFKYSPAILFQDGKHVSDESTPTHQ